LIIETKPILCFHGTREENIANIIENNFNLDRVGSATDAGFFGAGICKLLIIILNSSNACVDFSELPSISMSYAGGAKFLLCQVLVGQTYKMPKVQMGCGLKPGYHSHSSPCGSEIVSHFDYSETKRLDPLFQSNFQSLQLKFRCGISTRFYTNEISKKG
jgi:hypothetical protein